MNTPTQPTVSNHPQITNAIAELAASRIALKNAQSVAAETERARLDAESAHAVTVANSLMDGVKIPNKPPSLSALQAADDAVDQALCLLETRAEKSQHDLLNIAANVALEQAKALNDERKQSIKFFTQIIRIALANLIAAGVSRDFLRQELGQVVSISDLDAAKINGYVVTKNRLFNEAVNLGLREGGIRWEDLEAACPIRAFMEAPIDRTLSEMITGLLVKIDN